MGEPERFTFFWSGPFSQWWKSSFALGGVVYNTAEQYMMAEKARLFGDIDALANIMAAKHSRDQKALGRRVRGFDEDKWRLNADLIVRRGNRAKFTTHRDLLALLLATAGTTLVEASPLDLVWGIGMAADDPDATDRTKWRGANRLGAVLTRLREELLAEERAGGIAELVTRAHRKARLARERAP